MMLIDVSSIAHQEYQPKHVDENSVWAKCPETENQNLHEAQAQQGFNPGIWEM